MVTITERYWITGVQIGMLTALIRTKHDECLKLLKEIEDKQFIGNMPEPYSKHEIVIQKKVNK